MKTRDLLAESQEESAPTMPTRATAQAVARACARVLQDRFRARRVILFGSTTGEGPWHEKSDIDLAVEGVPPEQFFQAYSACSELVPQGLTLDLVPLEDVYPEIRARILGEVEMPEDPVMALKDLVEDELVALERVSGQMRELIEGCADPPTWIELNAMAALLHQFYTGAERIFERIAVRLEEGLPRGQYWHADLLSQMAEGREGIRPAVIDEPLRAQLKEYLDFRHFFRHAYGYNLEWVKLRPLAEGMNPTLGRLRAQLRAFFEHLIQIRQTSRLDDPQNVPLS